MKKAKIKDPKKKVMSPAVYALRRQVIDLIYEAKKLVPDLPRIEVRVTENHDSILGMAYMERNIIHITERSVASRSVVFHEILHAVYGTEHDETCPLMASILKKELKPALCDQLFVKHAKAATGKANKAA